MALIDSSISDKESMRALQLKLESTEGNQDTTQRALKKAEDKIVQISDEYKYCTRKMNLLYN